MESPMKIWLCILCAFCILVAAQEQTETQTTQQDAESIRNARYASIDTRYAKLNSTAWIKRDSILGLNIRKNETNHESKTKDEPVKRRGNVKFNQLMTSTTVSPRRRTVETTTKLVDKKTPGEIIDSMRDYKNKLSTPIPVLGVSSSSVEELTEESYTEDDDDDFDISKFTSDDFHDENNVFTLPTYPEDEDNQFFGSENKEKRVEYNDFRNYNDFDKNAKYKTRYPLHKSTTYHPPFFTPLTTPKMEYFDNRHKQISDSIVKHLGGHRIDNIKKKPEQETPAKRLEINDILNNKQKDNSKLYFHNTKKIVVSDNEDKGNSNKELSDVQGTSIYYEMRMVSTENYGDDVTTELDCENDTITDTTTAAYRKSTTRRIIVPTIPSILQTTKPTRVNHVYNRKNKTTTTKRPTKSPQKLVRTTTVVPKQALQTTEQPSRRLQYTSAKPNKVRMSPKRNNTRKFHPSTTTDKNALIFAHDLQAKRTPLTTLSTDIDPIYQGDAHGTNKVVDSQVLSDNNIPGLRKRGSTRYKASSSTPPKASDEAVNMSIPPTSAAWALAGMRNVPLLDNITNTTVEENEHQKNSKSGLNREGGPSSIHIVTDPTTKRIVETDENKIPWKPLVSPPTKELTTSASNQDMHIVYASPINDIDSYPTDPSLAVLPDDKTSKTTIVNTEIPKAEPTTYLDKETTTVYQWVAADEIKQDAETQKVYESITKLPAGMTTPKEDPTEAVETVEVLTTVLYKELTSTEDRMSDIITEATSQINDITTQGNVIPESRPTFSMSDMQSVKTETTPARTTEIIRETTTVATVTETPTTVETITEVKTTELPTTTIYDDWVPIVSTETKPIVTSTEEIPVTTYRPNINIDEIPTTTEVEREYATVKTTKINDYTTIKGEELTTELLTTVPKSTYVPTFNTYEADTTENIDLSTAVNTRSETITAEVTTIKESNITDIFNTTFEDVTRKVTDVDDLMTNFSVESKPDSENIGGDGSGAGVAIAVSTIGVIALVLLIALLLVMRRRNRRGVYAQRCTPVSLDAYSLDSVSVGKNKKGNSRLRASKRSYGNPAFDDEVVISHPMQYPALVSFALDVESITNEFTEIPLTTVKADEIPSGCEDKNRYSNIIPLPETRVQLTRINNDPTSEYINANYVPGPGNIKNYYIACQAPLSNTVCDYWRMIWEQNSRIIVMLTEYMESGVEKCFEYLPPSEVSDNKRKFGDYEVILKRRDQKHKYAVSTIQLKNTHTKTWREITHLWYFWPAKGVPEDYDSIIDFLLEMRSYMKISQHTKEYDEDGIEHIDSGDINTNCLNDDSSSLAGDVNVYSPQKAEENMKNGGTLSRMKAAEKEGWCVRPMTVVCASGCGRTGAIIVLDTCVRSLETPTACVDVPKVLRRIRAARPHALPNRQHYLFVYKVLSEYGSKLMGGVDSI